MIYQLLNDEKTIIKANHKHADFLCDFPVQLLNKAWKLQNGIPVLDEIAEQQRLDSIQAKLNAEALVAYKAKRLAEYPSVGDQMDALYKKLYLDDSSEYDALAEQIEAVKLKYPKPE